MPTSMRPRSGDSNATRPAGRERPVELGDLVALRQVGIEVVLAREHAGRVHACSRARCAPRVASRRASALGTGSAPGKPEADRADVGVGRVAERGAAAAEHLGAGAELHVHLEADDGLPAHQRTSAVGRRPRARAPRPPRACARPRRYGAMSCAPTGRPSLRPTGRLSAGRPGQADGADEDVGQVHRDRVVGLLARAERRRRRGRREQQVHAARERAPEVVGDAARACAAPFHSRRRSTRRSARRCRPGSGAAPRGRSPRRAWPGRARGCRRRARPCAGRTARRRSARDSRRPPPAPRCSTSAPRTASCGSETSHQLGAELANGGRWCARARRRRPGAGRPGSTRAEARSACPRRSGAASGARHRRPIQRGASSGSWPLIAREHPRRVVHGPAEDRDAIERRAERDEAEPAHPAVARLDADDPAEARRLAHRAAGLRAQRGGHHAGRHQRRRAARRSARHAGRVERMLARGRTPSARWTSPWRTRPCWSWRRSSRRPRGAGSTAVAS